MCNSVAEKFTCRCGKIRKQVIMGQRRYIWGEIGDGSVWLFNQKQTTRPSIRNLWSVDNAKEKLMQWGTADRTEDEINCYQ